MINCKLPFNYLTLQFCCSKNKEKVTTGTSSDSTVKYKATSSRLVEQFGLKVSSDGTISWIALHLQYVVLIQYQKVLDNTVMT